MFETLKREKIDDSLQQYHFDECIPVFGIGVPKPDVDTINVLPELISGALTLELRRLCRIFTKDFTKTLAVLSENSKSLPKNIYELPDMTFLYYKIMQDGMQHLLFCMFRQKILKQKKELNKQ